MSRAALLRSPRSVWYRAMKRVNRRALAWRALSPMGATPGSRHCPECERAYALWREAARLANALDARDQLARPAA